MFLCGRAVYIDVKSKVIPTNFLKIEEKQAYWNGKREGWQNWEGIRT